MDPLISQSALILVLIDAFLTAGVHHLFTFLTHRDQKISLLFSIRIFFGFTHQILNLFGQYSAYDFTIRTTSIELLMQAEAFTSVMVLLYALYGRIGKYIRLIAPTARTKFRRCAVALVLCSTSVTSTGCYPGGI